MYKYKQHDKNIFQHENQSNLCSSSGPPSSSVLLPLPSALCGKRSAVDIHTFWRGHRCSNAFRGVPPSADWASICGDHITSIIGRPILEVPYMAAML